MALAVFVSYSWSNSAERRALEGEIARIQGVTVLVDRGEIHPGDPIHGTVLSMIDSADCAVVFLTQEGLSSKEVLDEISRLHDRGKFIVPVVSEGTSLETLPWYLRDVNFIRYDGRNFDVVLDTICATITRLAKDPRLAAPAQKSRTRRNSLVLLSTASTIGGLAIYRYYNPPEHGAGFQPKGEGGPQPEHEVGHPPSGGDQLKSINVDSIEAKTLPESVRVALSSKARFVDLVGTEPFSPDRHLLFILKMRQTDAQFVCRVSFQDTVEHAALEVASRLLPHLRFEEYKWELIRDGHPVPQYETFETAAVRSGDALYLVGNHRMPLWAPSPAVSR